jgi:PAS domain S-box-containing protein
MDDEARLREAEERLRAAEDEGHMLRARLACAETALESLRESEALFRSLVDHANAIIGIVQGSRFVYVNPYFAEVSGFSRDELLVMDISHIIAPQHQAMVLERARLRQAGELPHAARYEFAIVAKDGRPIWLDFASALAEYHGKPAIIGFVYDITERKRTDETLRAGEELLCIFIEHAPAADLAALLLYFY